MTSKARSFTGTLAQYALLGLAVLILFWALLAGARWATRFQDSVTLPSGMQLGREFDWNRSGRWDLFATNGTTRLAREVEFICFNDRYIFVKSYNRPFTGLYDAETDSRVPLEYSDAMNISGLNKPGGGCDGYYTGWVGPSLLLDYGRYPFVPPCAWQNFGNDALRDLAWFERPCTNN